MSVKDKSMAGGNTSASGVRTSAPAAGRTSSTSAKDNSLARGNISDADAHTRHVEASEGPVSTSPHGIEKVSTLSLGLSRHCGTCAYSEETPQPV